MFILTHSGKYRETLSRLRRLQSSQFALELDKFGQRGVSALSQGTPKNSGETSSGWSYEIRKTPTSISIVWTNSVMAGGVPLAVLLQYGHGTRSGSYVEGRDYINPALRPVFDDIAAAVWAALTK
jgi:hypothetical protein